MSQIPNGVDSAQWQRGPGGDAWVWFGRIVPEKAPHLAILAARSAGARLRIAGRIGDPEYFAREVEPRLGDGVEYVGPLRQPELCALVGTSSVALVTPVWSEPFGLVLAEALMTGTPVVAFDEGGAGEVLAGLPGCAVVPGGDVRALAEAAVGLARSSASSAQRDRVRAAATARHSLARRHREVERVLAVAAHNPAMTADEIRTVEEVEAVGA